MRMHFDRRLTARIGAAFFAALFSVVFCLTLFNGVCVNADSAVKLSVVTSQTNIGQGDVLIVDVVADNMPNIDGFGPVVFEFDSEKADFILFRQGEDLINFSFSQTLENGVLTVTGIDQIMTSSDEEGEEVMGTPFYSGEPIVLFTVFLRTKIGSTGDFNCKISDAGVFSTLDEDIVASAGNGIVLPIAGEGSSNNATIVSLEIRGTVITPKFDPYITEYDCSVARSVSEVQVNVITGNLWASVAVIGNQNLSMGENEISIDVTAQDNINHMHYTVHVTRRESNVPDDATLVDNEDRIYTFVDVPEDAVVPEGFYPTNKTVNGYNVPAYTRDGVTSILLYLFDGNESAFYFYNASSKTVIRYVPERTLVQSSQVLRATDVPPDVIIPDDFIETQINTGSLIIPGYINNDGDLICYLSDEEGKCEFYYYDKNDNSISMYRFADKRAELLYSFLFDVFLVIAIIEAVIIIVAAYIVKRMVSERTNPRPKRV